MKLYNTIKEIYRLLNPETIHANLHTVHISACLPQCSYIILTHYSLSHTLSAINSYIISRTLCAMHQSANYLSLPTIKL